MAPTPEATRLMTSLVPLYATTEAATELRALAHRQIDALTPGVLAWLAEHGLTRDDIAAWMVTESCAAAAAAATEGDPS